MDAWFKLLDKVMADMPYGFSAGTPNGKVICYNKAMEEMSGYTREEVNERGWFDLVYPDPQKRAISKEKAVQCLMGRTNYAEGVIVCKDGTSKEIAFYLMPTTINHRRYNLGIMVELAACEREVEEEMVSILQNVKEITRQDSVVSLEAYRRMAK